MNHNRIPSRIFFVGPMGTGKTTIGCKLAEQLGMDFIDIDNEIERKTGADIPLIFELEGEEGFRKRESLALKEASIKSNIVIATGGGAIIKKQNRNILNSTGLTIYLRTPLEQLIKRTEKDRNRPLLQTEDPEKTLADLLKKREHLYEDVADIIFETDKKPLRDIISEITQLLDNTESNS